MVSLGKSLTMTYTQCSRCLHEFVLRNYRNSRYNWRLPFDHLEDLLCCLLAAFIFEALPGQLRKSLLELAVRDGAGRLVPTK